MDVLRCLKCEVPCRSETAANAWACDHPLHLGPGRTDRKEFTCPGGAQRWSCEKRDPCDFDICEPCAQTNVQLQSVLSEKDFELLSATCAATHKLLEGDPRARVVLYVDDEVRARPT